MRITGPGIWGEPRDYQEAITVVRRAVELGTNLIDTADSYGPEVSERIIADALYPYPTDLVIASKGGLIRSGPGEWYPNGRPEHLREALEGSLHRLRLDCIDLYQFHQPDPDVPFEESIGTLADLRAQGKIRHVGLSNVDAEQLVVAQHIVPIASIQNRYNLTDRESEDVLNVCERKSIGFIPWFPLASGDLARPRGVLDLIARRHDATPAQIALAWLLQRSRVMLPIPGTSSVAHLEENMHAGQLRLGDEEFQQLDRL
jgi:aryl-alcohol dehydrogenase-like predicted oxidoreductase